MPEVVLTGSRLSAQTVAMIARDPDVVVTCSADALARVRLAHDEVRAVVEDYASRLARPDDGVPHQDYGITTGFGSFKAIPVAPEHLSELQRNLLYSHSAGVGEAPDEHLAANYYAADVVRAALVVRLNAFLRGNSGVSPELISALAGMLNAGIIPRVPVRGSVGSSGDLAPLAHTFGVLLGIGMFTVVRTAEDIHRTDLFVQSARTELPGLLGRTEDDLCALVGPKAGLALTNGAAFSAAMLALGAHDASQLADVADCALALTLEAICGSARAFDPAVHDARPHPGQITSAANVRLLVAGSRQIDSSSDVQDSYSVRCGPQVHGASRQAITHALEVAEIEINSATDNPLIFPGYETPWDESFARNRARAGGRRVAYSAGNFHGQPVALAADYLTIALAELANISERRTQLLLDAHHNRNLPPNLTSMPGLNCGLMIAQYSAASLVSENKVLAHPASVDSIPTSANTEDHVAMANHAARKMLRVLGNAQAVLGIELIAAAQAIDWRVGMGIAPQASAAPRIPLQQPWRDVWLAHRFEQDKFAAVSGLDRSARTVGALGEGTGRLYQVVRSVIRPLTLDRPLDADIREAWRLIREGAVAAVLRTAGSGRRQAWST